MIRFSIVEAGGHKKDIQYLMKELRQKNLIAAVEKDAANEPIYITGNIAGVKRIMEDYDGLMLDIHKDS